MRKEHFNRFVLTANSSLSDTDRYHCRPGKDFTALITHEFLVFCHKIPQLILSSIDSSALQDIFIIFILILYSLFSLLSPLVLTRHAQFMYRLRNSGGSEGADRLSSVNPAD